MNNEPSSEGDQSGAVPSIADPAMGRVPGVVPRPADFADADWFLDLMPPYCFIASRGTVQEYLRISTIIEESTTVRELANRLLKDDVAGETFADIFGVETLEELEADVEDLVGDITVDTPWDPSLPSSYNTFPDTNMLWQEGWVLPDAVRDLVVATENYGCDQVYIPAEQYETVIERLRVAEVSCREVPGLLSTLLMLAHGGDRA